MSSNKVFPQFNELYESYFAIEQVTHKKNIDFHLDKITEETLLNSTFSPNNSHACITELLRKRSGNNPVSLREMVLYFLHEHMCLTFIMKSCTNHDPALVYKSYKYNNHLLDEMYLPPSLLFDFKDLMLNCEKHYNHHSVTYLHTTPGYENMHIVRKSGYLRNHFEYFFQDMICIHPPIFESLQCVTDAELYPIHRRIYNPYTPHTCLYSEDVYFRYKEKPVFKDKRLKQSKKFKKYLKKQNYSQRTDYYNWKKVILAVDFICLFRRQLFRKTT